MPNTIMLRGLPASGKSTYAKEQVGSDGNTGRVNRDDLRKMIFNGKWSKFKEKIIVDIEKAIASVLIDNGTNVIVDDTNLTEKHKKMWSNFSQAKGSNFEVKEFNVDLETCIARDLTRISDEHVGPNVITKMALRNGLVTWPDLPIVLVDIDGTLATASEERSQHVKKCPKDWASYYSLLHTDTPNRDIFKWVSELSKDHTIVIVSGRGAENEVRTLNWFYKTWNSDRTLPVFDPFAFLFRDKNDHRPDDIVKKEFLNLLPRDKIKFAIDDRPRVCRMWRSEGIMVIPVAGECEDF